MRIRLILALLLLSSLTTSCNLFSCAISEDKYHSPPSPPPPSPEPTKHVTTKFDGYWKGEILLADLFIHDYDKTFNMFVTYQDGSPGKISGTFTVSSDGKAATLSNLYDTIELKLLSDTRISLETTRGKAASSTIFYLTKVPK